MRLGNRTTPPRARWHRAAPGFLCCLLVAWAAALSAAEAVGTDPAIDPAMDPGLDIGGGGELLQFEEFPTVVSVTRQASAANLSSVPVTVITAREIHNSAARNVPELLQFVPGMDVLRNDRNHYSIGIRGMFSYFNDRILSLVDGQKTAQIAGGATNYLEYPVFLEDIKQIEVVRGPSGAAWGANAYYGVINILTKDPADTQGVMIQATTDQYGDYHTQFRWGAESTHARWRISAGYEGHVASAVALDENRPSTDAGKTASIDSKLVYEPDAMSKFTVGLAYGHTERDSFGFLGYRPTIDEHVNQVRTYGKYEGILTDDLTTAWTVYYNYEDVLQTGFWSTQGFETGLDAQFDYQGLANHQISFGGNVKYAYARQVRNSPQAWMFADNPDSEAWAGLFFVDRYQINDRLWLELQGRGDYFRFHQAGQNADASGRAAAIYSVDSDQNHVFRLSVARSFRTASMALRSASLRRIALPTPPFPPDTFAVVNLGGNDLQTESIWSLEAGYTGRFHHAWTVQANLFYHRLFDLITVNPLPAFGPTSTYLIDNVDGAVEYGGELEVEYKDMARDFSVRAFYAYAGFKPDRENVFLKATPPAPNKIGAAVDWQFYKGYNFNLDYRWVDVTSPGDSAAAHTARSFHQLDLAVSHRFTQFPGELMLGVIDAFNDMALPLNQRTPGRMFVLRGQVEF